LEIDPVRIKNFTPKCEITYHSTYIENLYLQIKEITASSDRQEISKICYVYH
jgi:hypothetical protein